MNDTKNIITVLKHRWPEVTLIVGLNILATITVFNARQESFEEPPILAWGFGALLIVFAGMLRLGFLRTFLTDGAKEQGPGHLLKIGIHFFWRMAALILIYTIPFMSVFFAITIFFATSDKFSQDIALLLQQSLLIFINLLIMKFVLMLPALIIVTDCSIAEAFAGLKKLQLLKAPALITLFVIHTTLPFVSTIAMGTELPNSVTSYIFTILFAIVAHLLSLLVAMRAVIFAADSTLVYDDEQSSQVHEQVSENIE